eukprot:scaffold26776_cov61-Phaeocystis_antarctica.AAC.2
MHHTHAPYSSTHSYTCAGGDLQGSQDGGRYSQRLAHRLDLRAHDLPTRVCRRAALPREATESARRVQGKE